jgi:hypothetical protein
MSENDRSQPGAEGHLPTPRYRRRTTPNRALTFPADLVHPPRSQVVQYGDAVADRIVKLDMAAQRLGEGFGMAMTSFVLNPLPPSQGNESTAGVVLSVVVAFSHREERVSLERRSGRWGLFFTRGTSVFGREPTAEAIALRDAPLDVRERFLDRSEDFFREYLKLCENRFGRMKASVTAGDQTLTLLANLHLE